MIPVFTGSVNRWECDENDHLNVRFYGHKMYQTLQAGLLTLGGTVSNLTGRIQSAHMRYVAEARIAAPMTGYFGVLSQSADQLQVVTTLRHTQTDQLMASYVFDLAVSPAGTVEIVPMPEGAGSRGLSMQRSSYASLDLATARDLGFMTIGQGVIQAEEVDADGRLQFYQHIGRVSDAIPNLWASLSGAAARGEGLLGGAVLEYRTDKLADLSLDEPYVIASGFRALAEKTKHLVHLMFSAETGGCVTASEAIAINMDLDARKAVAIPDNEREVMTRLLISPPE